MRKRHILPAVVVVVGLVLAASLPSLARASVVAASYPAEGFDECRCALRVEDLQQGAVHNWTRTLQDFDPTLDPQTYGIGCGIHDAKSRACAPALLLTSTKPECDNVVPVPVYCAKPSIPSWCGSPWCYVADIKTCRLDAASSRVAQGLFFR